MHDVARAACPAVPLSSNGTAGQSGCATDGNGTKGGTPAGTIGLKALAKLVLQRDKARDIGRDSMQIGVGELSHRAVGDGRQPGQDELLAERVAMMAEPELPPPGTVERMHLDAAQRCMVGGLLQAARQPRD